jgi:hypothetical protein
MIYIVKYAIFYESMGLKTHFEEFRNLDEAKSKFANLKAAGRTPSLYVAELLHI